MKSNTIRKQFIDFFKDKNHSFIRSSSVVPTNDPTLLFTNAGMNQFKDIFLGLKKPEFLRAVNSQKCIRVSGKHNDLEEVGVDNFHHTFFEMLGNWSFGDYYKEDSINWAWELFTKKWNLDKKRLWISVYKDDNESYEIWNKITDLDSDRILKFGDKDNFWEMGETGPCGPCSEIHYYTGKDLSKQKPSGVNKNELYRELWNLVFIQYNREPDGSLSPLPTKHVDTGMGLERICSVMNGIQDHYLLDLFNLISKKITSISGKDYKHKNGISHRVISDHIRMLSFSIADGALPSNEGRGYVLRRVLRRAVRYGDLLDIKEPFLSKLVPDLISLMGKSFPEIIDKSKHIQETILREEVLFRNTLERGLNKFEEFTSNKNSLSGKNAFKLYDTYGFPLDLTKLICKEKNISIDEKGFHDNMNLQRLSSKNIIKTDYQKVDINWTSNNDELHCNFIGYDKYQVETKLVAYANVDRNYYLVLDETPFYYESGGQVSDKGIIKSSSFEGKVVDVQKINGIICHIVELISGNISILNDTVIAKIDISNRKKIMANHTATHLLHQALKDSLGNHVQQSGSLVTPDRLRFDFTHSIKLKNAEIKEIEYCINEKIQENIKINISSSSYEEAINEGALALFGEKYKDVVRVVNVPDFSKELCGGTHVSRTGEIGTFKIISESSLSSGIRRIEALTGIKCIEYLNDSIGILNHAERELRCDKNSLITSIINLKSDHSKIKKKNELLILNNQNNIINNLIQSAEDYNGVRIITEILEDELNPNIISDQFRSKIKNCGILLIAFISNSKPVFICSLTDDMALKINAVDVVKFAAKFIDGGGGGKKYYAKAGGKNLKGIQNAVSKTKKEVLSKI